ncbi:MAG: GNAT family N-acetyltransferase [Polyangiaceae bacterium]
MAETVKKAKKRKSAKRVAVRQLTLEDFDAVRELQLKCFPGMKPWLREQFESQQANFPEGQICVVIDGKIVASSSSLVVDFDLYHEWQNWAIIADNGYIRNHDPKGDTMYGIEIMVDPEYRGLRLSRRLYDARKQVAQRMNLRRIIIGGRIPGYQQHAELLGAEEYVKRVIAKELIDPVLTAQLANGFELRSLIADYLPVDKESMGYATFLEWTNWNYRADQRRKWRVVDPVRVGVVQYQMREIASFDEFAKHLEYFVDVAADQNSDFVVFPELITTQLMGLLPPLRPGLIARKLDEFTDDFVEHFRRLAIKYNVNIVGGSHFTLDDQARLFNTGFFFHRDGRISRQDKLHITPQERRWWGVTPGRRLEVFDTDVARVAILLCYDVQFPELARLAAKQGAHVLFVPFNTDDRYGHLRVRTCAQARCVENHVYVVTAGVTGNLPFIDNADTHYAQSGVFTPLDYSFSRDGIAAECTPDEETVMIQDLDIELLRQHRYTGTTTNWNDRRRDLYRIQINAGERSEEI